MVGSVSPLCFEYVDYLPLSLPELPQASGRVQLLTGAIRGLIFWKTATTFCPLRLGLFALYCSGRVEGLWGVLGGRPLVTLDAVGFRGGPQLVDHDVV